jgi:5-methylcytosine-specific restriction endonuclease McrA
VSRRSGRSPARIDRRRPSARQRLYDARWEKAAAAYLKDHPRCPCGAPATEVHHQVDHHGDARLFWREELWVALCRRCHSRITMRRLNAWRRTMRAA